ncbi:MAG: rRNA maturation protein [Archaeoglobaceae archaeon]
MILTTSRKPSRRTRSLAKALARFANWRYVNRGKMSLEDIAKLSSDFAIISEIKGNPAFITFYRMAKPFLRISFTVSNVRKVKMDDSPAVFVGKAPFDPLLINAIPQSEAGLKFARKVDFPKKVVVKKDRLLFLYGDELVFSMRIIRIEKLG